MCDKCLQEHGPGAPCPTNASSGRDPLLGLQLGSFRLVRQLGRGGMGAVYLGQHVSIGSRVAVKVLHEHLAAYPELVQRFQAEARAVNLIGHENIVNIFDMSAAPPRPYLIMEYLEGEPLSVRMREPLAAEGWVPLLAQACEALYAAHQSAIVHRDLKPDNIFLVKRAQGPDFVKLLDFGIAKLLEDGLAPVTHEGVIVGTPEYMSPEQATSAPLDGRADIYALGIIAFRLATGRLPFTGRSSASLLLAHTSQPAPSPRGINPQVGPALERVILRALEKAPEARFEHARALRAALEEALLEDRRAPPPSVSPPPRGLEVVAQLLRRPGAAPERLMCTDLTRGGCFLRTEGELPPLFSQLSVVLELPGGARSMPCEVVRHVSAEQARGWGMSPGFGVQFRDTSPSMRLSLEQLIRGEPVAPAREPEEDAAVRLLLARYQARMADADPYVLLGVAPDTASEPLRVRARAMLNELEAAQRRGDALPRVQRERLEALLARVREAADTLGHLERRALHDAERGNFRGVACCLAAGLTATRLEALRQEFLARHPSAAGTAHVHFVVGGALERDGQLPQALEAYERALALDPLELGLHQRYRVLKKALSARAGAPSP